MNYLLSFFILCYSTSILASTPPKKASLPTQLESESYKRNSPWSEGSWKMITENVIGDCQDYGIFETELGCIKQAAYDNYEFYQTTSENQYIEYHGKPWKKTTLEFIKCFGCH
jgi:hypothetical protein